MCQSKTWYELDVCVCFSVYEYCVTSNICEFYTVPVTQPPLRRGSSPPLYVQRSAISLFLFMRMSQFMQSHILQCGLRVEGNVQLYYMDVCVCVCNTSTSWWQSMNLFAAYRAVNIQPQCICAYGSLFCFRWACVCGFLSSSLMQIVTFCFWDDPHVYSVISLFAIHRIKYLE